MNDLNRINIMATVHFYDAANGGKNNNIEGKYYGCPFEISGKYFECRLITESLGVIEPGATIEVPIIFMSWDEVKSLVTINMEFTLWEGRTIARGIVNRIIY